MPRFALTLSVCAAALSLSACAKKEATDGLDATDLDATPLMATHAFDIPAPAISIAFSPNDVASWLGIIATIDAQGRLVTTNIEGRDTRNHGAGPYISVIGLTRIKQPAAFLALSEDGKLRPFIEADSNGNFKALPVSSDAPPLSSLCDDPSGDTDAFTAITKDGNLVRLSASIDSSAAITATALDGNAKAGAKCLTHGDATYILKNEKLEISGGPSVKTGGGVTGMTLVPAMTGDAKDRIVLSYSNGAPLRVFDAQSLKPVGNYTIGKGLSIAGLEGAISISATTAPFGGSAFNEGLVAVSDAASGRLVVLSRSYILGVVDASQSEN